MDPSTNGSGSGSEPASESPFPELLGFCSRAQTLISELLLLSDRIPPEFRDRRFDPVLFDLRYLDSPDEFELRIRGNAELEVLEDELREVCSGYLGRFFLFVNCAVVYYLELLKYLNDLEEGVYMQCTLDRILENEQGLQLLTESMTLFGCLLLLLEHFMSGFLREKFLVAHIRHDHCPDFLNLNHVLLLCRAHLPIVGSSRHVSSPLSSCMVSVQKPEDLFARFPFPTEVVDAVITRIRDGDMYNQVRHYPDPQHRTVALSSQAGWLYVLLFYSSRLLHDGLVMREIVDRFFKDCWVVTIFLYFSIDLFVSWDAYKEAKASLSSHHSSTSIHDRSKLHYSKVTDLLSELDVILLDGVLTKDYVLYNSSNLLSLVQTCNVTLRWLLLHRTSFDKKLRDTVIAAGLAYQVNGDSLLQLLLRSSKLEFEVQQLYAELLESRQVLWHEKKNCTYVCIQELSAHCSGSWVSSCKIKNENLKDLIGKLTLEVDSLVCTRTGSSGRIIYRVLSVLKDVGQIHQIEESLQIKQLLSEAQKCLQDMIKVLDLDNDTMSSFYAISNAVYAWGHIARFSELLSKKIEQNPYVLLILHAFFLKFRLLLDIPLSRIRQNQSSDLPPVTQHYSSKFAAQICETLEIVPVMLLRIFSEGAFQTGQPFHHLDKDNIHGFMQLDRQLNLAKAANDIAILSKGMTIMSKSFFGLINLDLQKWLEDQMRKKLSELLKNRLNSFSVFSNAEPDKLEAKLRTLSNHIMSLSLTMESIQDLLNLNGNHIWEEVFTEVLEHCAQREHAGYRKRRDSRISPSYLKELPNAETFLGHLLCQVLQLTCPSRSVFIEPLSGWFNAEGQELLGLHFFDLFDACVGQVGLARLDSLLTVLIKENLENASRGLKILLNARCLEELRKLDNSLGPATSLPLLLGSSYTQMIRIFDPSWDPWIDTLAFVGQLQLLRSLVSLKLKSACKVKAGIISSAMEGMLASINSQRDKILKSKGEDGASIEGFLQSLKMQQKLCGFLSPFQTVYISEDPPTFLGRFASAFSISQLSRYVLNTHLGTLTSRSKKSILDFSPVIIGLGTFLHQFHPFHTTQYLQFMGQYVRITAETTLELLHKPEKGSKVASSEVSKSIFWLLCFCKYMGVPKDTIDSCLPPPLITILHT
ncbi:putative WASH complex subunit strumpellin-like protein isoform X1 [Iris pallida]|uniref:WASH complex subunit strumpellin-like protein isoform X1 n=1 Tax=Iris pallida TaxID=29817 RepID=A0AAX6EU72_IRIPA|nr:putative WASH complex subunit strumpellin-like protein isoform X1 [Iris pallida]